MIGNPGDCITRSQPSRRLGVRARRREEQVMSDQTFERAALDGKDREQLHAIAAALGVKSIRRLRKAELVDAIVAAAKGGNGSNGGAASEAKPRKIRSARTSDVDAIGALAAEEDALAAVSAGEPEVVPIRRPARPEPQVSGDGGTAETSAVPRAGAPAEGPDNAVPQQATQAATTQTAPPAPVRSEGGAPYQERSAEDPSGASSAPSGTGDRNQNEGGGRPGGRDDETTGNKRRRRRRGRDRDGGGQGGGQGSREGAPHRADEPQGEPVEIEGLLDLRDEGYGFLRASGYLPGRTDAYVSASQVRRFALRKGDYVKGATRPAASNEKYPALLRVDEITGMNPEEARQRPRFEDLTPLFPDETLHLELQDQPSEMMGRIIDLISPIGKGQRGMIVSPPKAGKTTIIKQIVYSIERNNPECHVMVLLVDERPEEVTDMRRHVLRAEVVASTFDRPSDEHCHIAELTIERAKRLVEMGKDVVIILDGITRLARAYNLAAPASGRIMSGGIDAGALYPPKKFFGAARNVEEGGSLTIIATALVETNSKMDEHIFEEFKGTGNMELRLDRRLSERRIFPAIDVEASGTRHEELLFDRSALQQVWKLRRVLNALDGGAGLELLIDKIKTTKSNDDFLADIAKAQSISG